jgi:hypothetical protein
MAKLLHILGVAVDPAEAKAKNVRVTPEDRTRIGKKLRALRGPRRQVDVVAAMPKGYRISLGTLQAIEGYWYDVRIENVEIYAAFFETSVTALLREDEPRPVQPTDPRWEGLHDEHLEIARHYMRARKQVRACVELLLDDRRPVDPQLPAIILSLALWNAASLALVAPLVVTEADFLRVMNLAPPKSAEDDDDGPAEASGVKRS